MEGSKACRQSSKYSAVAREKQREMAENMGVFRSFAYLSVLGEVATAEDIWSGRTSRGGRGGRNLCAKWLSPAKLGGILQDSPTSGRSGETGRRAGLKIPWGSPPVRVRFPPPAPPILF